MGKRHLLAEIARPRRGLTGHESRQGKSMNQNPQESSSDGTIVICPDGPILVRGEFEIVTPSGGAVPRTRKTIALCRCGASAIKPYCDGTHKLIGFRTEIPAKPGTKETT